jgi:phosphatidylglycerophosphate synthase
MRSADAATVFRALLAIVIAYAIIAKFNAALIVIGIGVTILLDAFDGYLAIRESSKGAVSLLTYSKYLWGNESAKALVKKYRSKSSKEAKYGPRMDVAGDRVVEYTFWLVFTYLRILPLFVILLVIVRHSFVDAIMGARGTSSKMKTNFAKMVYASNIGRGGINVVKFLAFSYLALIYILGYPAWPGYVLTAILLIYILLRGIAEIYESTR